MERVIRPLVDQGAAAPPPVVDSARNRVGISVIVPCWRDDAVSSEVAARWLDSGLVGEVLIASASGGTNTPVKPASARMRVVHCPRPGRGIQMNTAARLAIGEVLLFHHADTELTDSHLRSLVDAMHNPEVSGGAFRRRFDERHPHLRWLEPWEALRCRWFGPVFGDQSIFVRRTVFERMGGFADVPLMEDIEFSCRLRKHLGGLIVLSPAIGSSARKHLQQGRWRTTFFNTLFLVLYVLGVSPQRLHSWYYRQAQSKMKVS